MRGLRLAGLALLLAALSAAAYLLLNPHNGRQLRLPGLVEIQEVRLGSKQGGRVAEIFVQEGQLVEPGQPLVRFDMPEMEAQRQQWQARLAASQAYLDKVRNGPRAEEKEEARSAMEAAHARFRLVSTGYRAEEIRQAKSELAAAEADYRLAKEELERADRLVRMGSMSKAEYDAARSNHDRALSRAAATRARFDWLQAGYRPEEIAEVEGQYKQARARHELLQAGSRSEDIAEATAQVAETRGKLREIEAHLEEAVVTAPERAVIEVLAVRKGDLVAPNQPVVRVLRAEDLWVKVYVPETELGKLRLNQPVEVTIDSYPGRRFAGQVIQIASISEFTPRNVQSVEERRHQVFAVKVRVDDPQGIFKSGMAAEVVFPVE